MPSPASSWGQYLWKRMWTKHEANSKDLRTDLIRCLSTWQLTLLGLGNTIGVGIYVLLGVMVKEEAGPSVIFSFLIAIVVTWMNAMVFAEFSTYVPQTGAAYIFLYKVFGEFAAFLVGSLTICSGLLCGSVGARAWSGMLDSFFNNTLQDYTVTVLGRIEFGPPFAEKMDIVAFVFLLVIMVVVLFNILCTSVINTVLGALTSSVLVFVFLVGMIHGDSKNFLNSEHGGIFPFGAVGVVKAASMALYAMSGFEIVSMSSEECKNPAKSIPRAMVAELLIVGLIYIGAAMGMMFLIPYWMVDLRAPLPSALEHSGLIWGKMVVTIGPMFGITNLQMLSLYGLSRSIYRMSKDGLLFSFFMSVDSRTGVPQRAVLFSGLLMSVFALLFDLSYIVKMSLILMLTCYISVAAALIRLKVDEKNSSNLLNSELSDSGRDKDFSLFADADEETLFSREVEDHSGSAGPGAIDRNRSANNNHGTTGDMSVLFSNTTEFENESEKYTERSNQDLVSKSSLENSEKFYNGRSSEENTDKEQMVDLSSLEEQSDISLIQNGASSNHSKPVTALTDLNGHNHKHNGESHRLTLASEAASASASAAQFPGVPTSLLIGMHVVTCVTLSGHVIYGWEDLRRLRTVAVLASTMLVFLLVLFSVLLGLVCSKGYSVTQSKDQFFQTPLMPLIPTCSIVLSSMMLFSAAEKVGCVEVVVMIVMAFLIYILMTFAEYKSTYGRDLKGPAQQEAQEQEMRLISSDGETDDMFYDAAAAAADEDDDDWK